MLGRLGEQLRVIDRQAPVYDVVPFAWRVRQLVMPQRRGLTLFAIFSALALTLAAIGIYGVASYVAALLATIALIATWIPARRAAKLDPIKALRQD